MTDKFSSLKISEINIPNDMIIPVSEKRIDIISQAFGTQNEMLFFTVVVKKNNSYHLVDRYDVYLAAKKSHCKNIRAFILSDVNDVTAHITLSQKHFANPATILRLIKSYVKQHGLEETLQMFYLDLSFGKMYNANLDDKVLNSFEEIINYAYCMGVRSTVPVQLFEELSKYGSVENQIDMVDRIHLLVDTQRGKFRWPHREFLRLLSSEPVTKPSTKKEKKADIPARNFDCCKCGASHVVTPDHIGPRNEKEGIILITDDDNISEPVYSIPQKYKKHLGLSKDLHPIVLSSKDTDWITLKKKLDGKNFVVFVGSDSR